MTFGNPERFSGAETPDRAEMVENSKNSMAMDLFRRIMEDFSHQDFLLGDISDSYNKQGNQETGWTTVRYGKSHLDYLVEKGLLIFDEEN